MPSGQATLEHTPGSPPDGRSGDAETSGADLRGRVGVVLSSGSRLFRPGWPLAAYFIGYPIWWILGVSQIIFLLVGIPLALELVKRRRVHAPRGFGMWLLFLAWVVVGVLVLQVDAPGAIADSSSSRYLTFAYRLAWYLTGTVVLLYIGNMRDELPLMRVSRILSWMFVTVTIGGLLGTLIPQVDFPSLVEILLPGSLTSVGFVHGLIHPSLAQFQDILGPGQEAPRPSAPFTYTNDWGLAYVLYLPFFVLAWFGRDAGRRRYVAPVLLAASLVPLIKTLDRGAWIAVIMIVVFVAARAAYTGRARALGAIIVATTLLGGLIVFSPLGTVISERIAHPHSNQGRTNLAVATVTSAFERSPVIGLGSTRQVQGNFNSINGGATASCPRCSPPSLGTQGQLWLLIFSQGFAGAFLYIAFFAMMFFRHLKDRSKFATPALSVLVALFATMPVYTNIGPQLLAYFVAAAFLWRLTPAREGPTIGGYSTLLRQYGTPVLIGLVAGALLGGGWQLQRGSTYTASISVLVPAETDYADTDVRPQSLDSDAQFVGDPRVAAAMSQVVGYRVSPADTGLRVTATPNTRVIQLIYTAGDERTAERVVTAAAGAFLEVRKEHLDDRQKHELSLLRDRSRGLQKAIAALSDTVQQLKPADGQDVNAAQVKPLQSKLTAMTTRAKLVDATLASVAGDPLDAGRIVQPTGARPALDGWFVSVSSGLMAGGAIGALIALLMHSVTGRLRNRRRAAWLTGLPVLTEVEVASAFRHGGEGGVGGADTGGTDSRGSSGTGSAGRGSDVAPGEDMDARLASLIHRPVACLSVRPDEPGTRAVAARLDASRPLRLADDAGIGRRRRSIILVASPSARAREVNHLERSLRLSGSRVVGVVLVDDTSGRRGAGRVADRLTAPAHVRES